MKGLSGLPLALWQRGIFSPFLFPLAWIYGKAMRFRERLYLEGFLHRLRLPCKVICVGNITLGGSGKTPMVEYLARHLKESGIKVGVLSRGYRGRMERSGGVISDGRGPLLGPEEAGDEAWMLAEHLPGVPVVVGRDRYGMGLLMCERFGTELIIMDDGFQHLRLMRDVDLVLLRPSDLEELLFPQGRLREPLSALRRADLLVITHWEDSDPPEEGLQEKLRQVAGTLPTFHATLRPLDLYDPYSGASFPLSYLEGRRVCAFCGIASPETFFQSILRLGGSLVAKRPFRDHHVYSEAELAELESSCRDADLFLTTSKDAVKLRKVQFSKPLYVLRVKVEVEGLLEEVRDRLSLV